MMTMLRCVLLTTVVTMCRGDKFTEELLLTPLSNGHLSAYFKFTTLVTNDIRSSHTWTHYDLLSRPLGELLGQYSVQELTMSLTQGVWRHNGWGYPVVSAPPGAEVSARFLPSVPADHVDNVWEGLTDGLAGLLCASLNKLDRTQAITPKYSFQPRGVLGANLTGHGTHFRYGTLPKENVCTENLTPWKKLLPCKGKRGLAVLLNSGSIQKHSSYQSLRLDVRPVCADQDCSSMATELSMDLSLVFDPAIYNSDPTNTDWSLKRLFGIGVAGTCPMATTSNIFVDMTGAKFSLSPGPDRELDTGSGTNVRRFAVYDVSRWSPDNRIRDLAAGHVKPHVYGVVPLPVLTATRYLTGLGKERGGVRTSIKNIGKEPLTVTYLDIIPWYLRVYLHTLKIVTSSISNSNSISNQEKEIDPIKLEYIPGVDRKRPYHVEMVLKLPPKSVTTISFQFELSILRWVEYPPDANHGFYVGSAAITARIQDNKNVTQLAPEDSTLSYAIWGNPPTLNDVSTLYTETLLVSLPTPDFSMPYNVICLACTVAALAFGPIHNITTKSLAIVSPDQVEPGLLGKIIKKIMGLLSFLKRKKKEEKKEEETEENEKEEEKEESTEHTKDKEE